MTEALGITAVWHNGGCSTSYDSFVLGSSVVLQLNFCAKNPSLRQAAKPLCVIQKETLRQNSKTWKIKKYQFGSR